MFIRRDKNSQRIIKTAINLALTKSYRSASQMLLNAGISELIIDRILYEPHNVRKTDLSWYTSFKFIWLQVNIMKARTNVLFSHIVNKSLIMYKFRGYDKAMHMMVKAGLPRNVINRVLNKSASTRISDWHWFKIW